MSEVTNHTRYYFRVWVIGTEGEFQVAPGLTGAPSGETRGAVWESVLAAVKFTIPSKTRRQDRKYISLVPKSGEQSSAKRHQDLISPARPRHLCVLPHSTSTSLSGGGREQGLSP